MAKRKKASSSRRVRCLTTGVKNAPFLNGVKMKDQTCETQAEADQLVATGLFAFADDGATGADEGADSALIGKVDDDGIPSD